LYVEMMGGADDILAKGADLFEQGKYQHAMEILNKLVYAEPGNEAARLLLADTFEQLGFQYESTSMRNAFLSAAGELRTGVPEAIGLQTAGADMLRAITTTQWWDAVAVRVDSARADGIEFKLNFVTPDNGEQLVVEMNNGTLTNIVGFTADDADATLTINRSDLLPVMAQQMTFADMLQSGKATVDGDVSVLAKLQSTLVEFDPLFEIMPGTRR
jgi:alkyl sulfatase BDS1-like metallo-beta-lactamase superfamily hydrolase